MRARIDISEVEAQTKIRAKYLRALENEEWDLLPGSVYVKSFLKTYGEYLGLDSRLLVDEFKRRYERPTEHEARPATAVATSGRDRDRGDRRQRGPRRSRGTRLRPSSILSPPVMIIVLLLGIVAALYLVGTLGSGGNGGNLSAGTTPRTSDLTTTTNSSTQTTSTTKTGKKKPRHVTMAIVPTAPVYVCVKNGNGKQLLVGTYTIGDTVPSVTAKILLVTFGNANASVKLNGRALTLTPSSVPIGLRITHAGAKPLSPGPTCA